MSTPEQDVIARWMYRRDGMGMGQPLFDRQPADVQQRYQERAAEWWRDHRTILRPIARQYATQYRGNLCHEINDLMAMLNQRLTRLSLETAEPETQADADSIRFEAATHVQRILAAFSDGPVITEEPAA